MYNSLYYLCGHYEEKTVEIMIIPDFMQDVAETDDGEFYSDMSVIIHSGYVFANENAQWFCVKNKTFFDFYVTERTRTIETKWGEAFDGYINELLEEAKEQYKKQKNEEIRLYLYESYTRRIKRPVGVDKVIDYKYDIQRDFIKKYEIEWKYGAPMCDSFVIGKVCRTEGDQKGELVDVIEPVTIIPFAEKYEEFECYKNYISKRRTLYYCISELMLFTAQKEYPTNTVVAYRIKSYLRRNKCGEKYPDDFISLIREALTNADISMIIMLHQVLYNPQDCNRICFNVILPQEGKTVFKPDEMLQVEYDNKETAWISVERIHQIRDYCRNATVRLLKNRKKFIFNKIG